MLIKQMCRLALVGPLISVLAGTVRGQVAQIDQLRLVSGSVVAPEGELIPVRIYRIGDGHAIHLVKEILPRGSNRSTGDSARDAGTFSINIVGPHLFVDYPYEMPNSTIVVSTLSGNVEANQQFADEFFGNGSDHVFEAMQNNQICDVWSVPGKRADLSQTPEAEPFSNWSVWSVCATQAGQVSVQKKPLEGSIQYPGEPGGGTNLQFRFAVIRNGALVLRRPGALPGDVLLSSVPEGLEKDARGTSGKNYSIMLRAVNEHYLVLKVFNPEQQELKNKAQLLEVINVRTGQLRSVKLEGDSSLVRIFGNWLASETQNEAEDHCGSRSDESGGLTPGELDKEVNAGNVPKLSPKDNPRPLTTAERSQDIEQGVEVAAVEEFAARRACKFDVVGTLELVNLDDQRRIVINGASKDVEAVAIFDKDDLVLRDGSRLYLQSIANTSPAPRQLLADDPMIAQVHWAFTTQK